MNLKTRFPAAASLAITLGLLPSLAQAQIQEWEIKVPVQISDLPSGVKAVKVVCKVFDSTKNNQIAGGQESIALVNGGYSGTVTVKAKHIGSLSKFDGKSAPGGWHCSLYNEAGTVWMEYLSDPSNKSYDTAYARAEGRPFTPRVEGDWKLP